MILPSTLSRKSELRHRINEVLEELIQSHMKTSQDRIKAGDVDAGHYWLTRADGVHDCIKVLSTKLELE